MKQKRIFQLLGVAIAFLFMAVPLTAQKADFSGKWTYNESKSEVGGPGMGPGGQAPGQGPGGPGGQGPGGGQGGPGGPGGPGGGPGPGGGGFMASSEMTVQQDASKIVIERTSAGMGGQEMTTSETVTLDGKENVVENERGSTKTTATWSGDGEALTFKIIRTMSMQGQSMEMTSSEIWKLTDGGKTLTIESSTSTPMGEMTNTFVYDKS